MSRPFCLVGLTGSISRGRAGRSTLPKGHYVVTRSRPYFRTLRKASRRDVSGWPEGVQVGQSQPPSSCSFQA